MAWHVESDADQHVWIVSDPILGAPWKIDVTALKAERDHYREWLSQLQDAANEVRGYWGIEGEDGYAEAIGDLAAILDGIQASAALGEERSS
jgi:hypothetical protein